MTKNRPIILTKRTIATGLALLLILLLAACNTAAPITGTMPETGVSQPSPTPVSTQSLASDAITEAETVQQSETTSTTTATIPSPSPSPTPTPAPTTTVMLNVDTLHDSALVIDTHNDTVLKIIDDSTWLPKISLANPTRFMVDLPKLKAGGIDVATFASYTKGYMQGGQQDFTRANSRLLALINAVRWLTRQNPQTTLLLQKASDLDRVSSDGQIGILASIEGAYSFSDDNAIELLRQYRDLGIRMLAPVWNNANALGVGAMEVYRDGSAASGGLTATGKAVISEMNRIGLVVDVSHMNEESFWDAINQTTAPVVASHSSAYALCAVARNLKDEQIQAVADNGGVIQAVFYRAFLSLDKDSVTVSTLVDHLDYLVDEAGIDHVGLGSDFDGASMPSGLENASKYIAITRELKRRGYSDTDIKKILGGNTARLLADVWQHGQAITSTDLSITTDLSMGGPISGSTPTLAATAVVADGQTLDTGSLEVIIDGYVYQPVYEPETGQISYAVEIPLEEKFHVVTQWKDIRRS